jgi:hypothetical protein
MRIMSSLLFKFARRADSGLSSSERIHRNHSDAARHQDHSFFHPIGQSYTWGGPTTASNGFAPAIGYDAYLGGNGY